MGEISRPRQLAILATMAIREDGKKLITVSYLQRMISQHAPIPPGEWCHVCGSDWVDGGCPECGK